MAVCMYMHGERLLILDNLRLPYGSTKYGEVYRDEPFFPRWYVRYYEIQNSSPVWNSFLAERYFFLPIFRVAELWPCSLCISWKLECFLNTLSTNESRTSVEYLNVRSSRMDLEKPSLKVWKKKENVYLCFFNVTTVNSRTSPWGLRRKSLKLSEHQINFEEKISWMSWLNQYPIYFRFSFRAFQQVLSTLLLMRACRAAGAPQRWLAARHRPARSHDMPCCL